jgi:hypothetical protein
MASIEVEYIGRISVARMQNMVEAVTLAYATEVMKTMRDAIPRPPQPGAQKYKSEKQRRFVMAAIKRGDITVPYLRGTGSKINPSHDLNAAYRVDKLGTEAVLASTAPYAEYVVGDKQAPIHQDRWPTAVKSQETVQQSGLIQYLVTKAMENV